MSLDLASITENWPYSPDDESANVRLIRGDDARDKVQIRIPSGILQWEADGRPDGQRPQGFESLLHYLQHQVEQGEELVFDDVLRHQLSEEVMGYYARRVALFRIGHNLAMMNLLRAHCDDEAIVQGHEKWRPFVLMDRTRAIALEDARQKRYTDALDSIDEGINEIQDAYAERGLEEGIEKSEEIRALRDLKFYMRETYDLGLTLKEMLRNLEAEKQQAVAEEDFETAAKLSKDIERLRKTHP
jgi:hypothetical protein